MATPLDRRYRNRLDQIRRAVAARITALYGSTISGESLDDEFGRLFLPAAGIVAAGQSQARATASGYLRALITLGAGRTAALPVLSLPSLADITKRMDAWPAMVKGQIGEGRSLIEALDTGRYLAERFADREVVGTVDAQTELATKTGQFRGWEGIVSPESCDPCKDNEGFHQVDEPIYRHGTCQCDRMWVVAD